jgi:uncharacterized repeat protein (TIGR01451 family)
MNTFMKASAAAVFSVVIASSVISPAYAWHPQGKITKSVQNMTAGGEAKPADSATTAVAAKPGDILQYTIEVHNAAAPADKQYNDLAHVVMTDTLPAGVELVSDPALRTIKVDMPVILPGNSVVKQYQVKVTDKTDGKVIENKACFTGDSVVKDNPQKGCDTANVKVTVPVVPATPATPTPVTPAPTAPAQGIGGATELAAPEVLPNAGVGSSLVLATLFATVLGYFVSLKRRALA